MLLHAAVMRWSSARNVRANRVPKVILLALPEDFPGATFHVRSRYGCCHGEVSGDGPRLFHRHRGRCCLTVGCTPTVDQFFLTIRDCTLQGIGNGLESKLVP